LTVVLATKEITVTRFPYFVHEPVTWMNTNARKPGCSPSVSISGLKGNLYTASPPCSSLTCLSLLQMENSTVKE